MGAALFTGVPIMLQVLLRIRWKIVRDLTAVMLGITMQAKVAQLTSGLFLPAPFQRLLRMLLLALA